VFQEDPGGETTPVRSGSFCKSLAWESGRLRQALVPLLRMSPGPDVAHKYNRDALRKVRTGASRSRRHMIVGVVVDGAVGVVGVVVVVVAPSPVSDAGISVSVNSIKASQTDFVAERRIGEGT